MTTLLHKTTIRPNRGVLLGWTIFATFLTVGLTCNTNVAAGSDQRTVRVFVLAGQSNMQGQAVVDLDHPQHYNRGRGTLVHLMASDTQRFAHLKNAQNQWRVREDVWVRYQTPERLKSGGLGLGFTGYSGQHHFGPELQFGHVVGDALDDPVLLIKTAWGGKSLFRDFRPPSSGGVPGPFFQKMVAQVRQGLASYRGRVSSTGQV